MLRDYIRPMMSVPLQLKIFPVPLPQESFGTELLCPSPQNPIPGSKKKGGNN